MTPTTEDAADWLALPVTPARQRLISLTPLIDVVFILLVFFMLATSSIDWRAIGINSDTSGGAGSVLQSPLIVYIDADGILSADGHSAPIRMAAELVEARLSAGATGTGTAPNTRAVLVVPSAGVSLQQAVGVVDVITQAGVRRVSLSRGE